MPAFEQPFPLFKDEETSMLVAYQAFKNLGWTIEFAGDRAVSATLPAVWKKKDYAVICRVSNGALSVVSESVNNQSFDLLGKNKKNAQRFITAFQAAIHTEEQVLEKSRQPLQQLRLHTREQAEKEMKTAEEVTKALNLEGSNLYVTYAIIAINVLVFVLMAINGAGIFEANGLVHLQWGSNYKPLTLSGDWWRLITCVFLHFGIIHLLMNMYCLYTISIYLEPFLGKIKFTAAYLCTGVLASVTSLWWHADGVNSAGASGAVFGMYGVFLALLTTKLVPVALRQSLLQNIVVFVVFNLLYGTKGTVDNAAHVGGLLSGLVIGYGFVPVIMKERKGEKMNWVPAAAALLTVLVSGFYLQQHPVSAGERDKVVSELKEEGYRDYDKFNKQLGAFDKISEEVYNVLADTTLSNSAKQSKIDRVVTLGWQKAAALMKETAAYDISPAAHHRAELIQQYVVLRQEETVILKQYLQEPANTEVIESLNGVRNRYNVVMDSIMRKEE